MAPSLCSRQRQLGRAITVSSRFLQRKYTLTVLLQIVNMKEKAVKDRSLLKSVPLQVAEKAALLSVR